MYYNIINPSDTYTLKADEVKVAAIVTLLLGGGKYGLEDKDRNCVVPIMAFGGDPDEWATRKFGCDIKGLYAQADWLAVAECFESVAIVGIEDRQLYDEALAAMPEPARSEWRAKWHDTHRSSMNDIGGRAAKYAERAREKAAQQTAQTCAES